MLVHVHTTYVCTIFMLLSNLTTFLSCLYIAPENAIMVSIPGSTSCWTWVCRHDSPVRRVSPTRQYLTTWQVVVVVAVRIGEDAVGKAQGTFNSNKLFFVGVGTIMIELNSLQDSELTQKYFNLFRYLMCNFLIIINYF